jgi:hypothetical protein
MTIRELSRADLPFLRKMLCAALFWRPRWRRLPRRWVLFLPQVAIYHRGWGRPGDTEGIGRRLIEAIHEQARADGVRRIALSVDQGNPARRLYLALGYLDYEPGDGLGRMILDLG